MSYPSTIDSFATQSPGNVMQSSFQNSITTAVVAVETAVGTNPSGAYSTVADALDGKIDSNYAAGTLSSGVYAVTLSPAPSAYTAGLQVRFQASAANTGAVSVNVNSLGNVSIVKQYDLALEANDIVADQIVVLCYDGSNFQMVSPTTTLTTLGDTYYGGTSGAVTRLAGTTSSTKQFLTQTGTGSISAAPAWDTIAPGDLPTLDQIPSPVASVSMNSERLTNLANPSSETDAVNAETVQKASLTYSTDSGSANTYVVSLSPAPSSYTVGMLVSFIAAHANTGASTLNVNSLGAISILKQGSTALQAGDIGSGAAMVVVYDGTNFQVANSLGSVLGVGGGGTGSSLSTPGLGVILASNGSVFEELAAGTSGNSLVADSTQTLGVKWGIPHKVSTSTKTGNYSVASTDVYIRINAASNNITITLPDATTVGSASGGNWFLFKRVDSSGNTVTIATTASQTIDGNASYSMPTQYETLWVVSNGSNWDII